jgi:lipopolysaccharide assembly protein B
VPDQDPRYLGEVLEPLRRCHEVLQDAAGYRKFLDDAEEFWQQPSVVYAKARLMQAENVDPSGYLMERLQQQPQWRGLELLLSSVGERAGPVAPILEGMRKSIRSVMEKRPAYQCVHCGFTPSLLFWQCPRCKQWTTVVPLDEMTGAARAA